MPTLVTCLYFSSNGKSENLLFLGDIKGNVGYLQFHQPLTGLFEGKRFAGVEVINFKDLSTVHQKRVKYVKLPEVHGGPVKSVRYFLNSGTVISCSLDSYTSLIIQDITRKMEPKHFSTFRGIADFAFNPMNDYLITNSKKIEMIAWKCNSEDWKFGRRKRLKGHRAPVSSMQISSQSGFLLTLDIQSILLVWSPTSLECLLEMRVNFPRPSSLSADRCQSIRPFLFTALGDFYAAQGKYLVKLDQELSQLTEELEDGDSTSGESFVEEPTQPRSPEVPKFLQVKRELQNRKSWILSSGEERSLMLKECVKTDRPFSALKYYDLDALGAMPKAEDHLVTVFASCQNGRLHTD